MANVAEPLLVWVGGGFGAGVGFYFIKWFFEYLGGRVDKREAAVAATAAHVDAATHALITHLQNQITSQAGTIDQLVRRIDTVEAELEECRSQHARDLEEIARLRGGTLGLGDARQQAAAIVAAERVSDRLVSKLADKSQQKD